MKQLELFINTSKAKEYMNWFIIFTYRTEWPGICLKISSITLIHASSILKNMTTILAMEIFVSVSLSFLRTKSGKIIFFVNSSKRTCSHWFQDEWPKPWFYSRRNDHWYGRQFVRCCIRWGKSNQSWSKVIFFLLKFITIKYYCQVVYFSFRWLKKTLLIYLGKEKWFWIFLFQQNKSHRWHSADQIWTFCTSLQHQHPFQLNQ